MRWYDYVVCLIIADFAAAAIMAGSLMVILPIFWYLIYEDYRKWMTNKQ